MFELNLATLPNSVLYIEGVQLSYIKVYVQIFNLWYSHNPCFISNAEFAKRTGLHRDTVINAIQFFEKNGILKRVQKGSRRYLVQTSRFLETETDSVDKSKENCTNIARGSELDQGGSELDPPKGSELDHHNNKINNKKISKSFCDKNEQKKHKAVDKEPLTEKPYSGKEGWKEANQKKHSWAEQKESSTADVTKQSTSYDATKYNTEHKFDPNAPGYQSFVNDNPAIKRAHERRKIKATEPITRTVVQPEIPSRTFSDVQGAAIDVGGRKDIPPNIRSSDGLLEARRVHSFLEETGLAGENRTH